MKPTKYCIRLIIGSVSSLLATNALATTLLFNDFSDISDLQLNYNASQSGDVLRLTSADYWQRGSAFSTSSISLDSDASFSSAFQFQITGSGGSSDNDGYGADGIVFTVQTASNTAGGAGNGIGYLGLDNSVGIEFDTWNNGGYDENNGNHVGIDINGNINSVDQIGVDTRMNNGDIWSAWVDYNGVSDILEVRLAQGAEAARPLDALLSYGVDLSTILGTTNAYVGFTSATGAAYGNHDVLAWEFNSTYAPIDQIGNNIPEPATIALLSLGLPGLIFSRRRKSLL